VAQRTPIIVCTAAIVAVFSITFVDSMIIVATNFVGGGMAELRVFIV